MTDKPPVPTNPATKSATSTSAEGALSTREARGADSATSTAQRVQQDDTQSSPVNEIINPDVNNNGVYAVPGMIIDPYTGKQWPVPSGQFLDNVKPYLSPYDFPKDPNFHYECHTIKEVAQMESQGFVKVTRKEVGLPDNRLPGEQASPLDSYYVINGEQVALKIPKVYGDARYRTLKKYCDEAVASTEPPKDLDSGANSRLRNDPLAEVEMTRETIRGQEPLNK